MRFVYRLAQLVAGIVVLCVSFSLVGTAQVLTVPSDITVECGGSTMPSATGMATASDACNSDPISITSSDDTSGLTGCGNTGTITRTWVATDGCSTTVTDVQIITIADTTPPTISCPGTVSLACGTSAPAPDPGSVAAEDDCSSDVSVAHEGDVVQSVGTTIQTLRTYSATDDCGNMATCTQTFVSDCAGQGVFYNGTVFNDVNGNGTQDAGETGYDGATLTLVDVGPDGAAGTSDDTPVISSGTDGDGDYSLLVLDGSGTYYLSAAGPEGASFPGLNDGFTGTFTIPEGGGTAPGIGIQFSCGSLQVEGNVVCGSDDAFFTVVVNVLNGQAPFTVSGGFSGFFGTNNFILGPLPNLSSYSFTVVDNAGCTFDVSSGGPVDCSTVAVDLLSFNGEVLGTANQLKWSTASEVTERFLLERSEDGTSFDVIANVLAVGSEAQGSNYTFVDNNAPQRGVTYYRLSELDLNGQVRVISSVIELRRDVEAVKIDFVAPVPTSDLLNVGLTGTEGSSATISVFNIVGQNVYQTIETLRENGSQLQIDVNELPAGVYILQVSTGEVQAVQEFVVTD